MTLALYDLTQDNVATYNSAEGWFENAGKVRRKALRRRSTPR
jgi:iron complex outermembrane receptor protein